MRRLRPNRCSLGAVRPIAPILALLALAALPARAEDLRDLCAQRPGKATPPCILDTGHLQIETGLADAVFQRGGGQREDTYSFGASELRFGITKRVEIEAGWSPLVVDTVRGGERVIGSGDVTLGVLAALTDPDGKGAAVSLQGFITAPTATHGLGAGGWTGGVRLPAAIPLADNLSLGLTPEVDVLRNATGGGTHLAWIGVASLGRTFGKTSLGAELWAMADDDPAGRATQATFDLTAAQTIGDNLQLDAGANLGLNHATPDVEIYVGVSRRF
jgi:hypothetical protein